MKKTTTGFTIVELLIVIVVIAILAAISVVAYNGLSRRANNTSTINAASTSLKMIQAYIAQEEGYPLTHATGETRSCITSDSGCRGSAGNVIGASTSFTSRMASIGSLPRSASADSASSGVIYFYRQDRITYNGESQSAWLVYLLEGTNQDCMLAGVLSGTEPFTASSASYSSGNDAGKTRCNILIPGPAQV